MNVPAIPQDFEVNYTHQWIGTSIGAVGLAICLGVAIWHLAESKGPIPLYLLAGGLLTASLEPALDVLGLCWHPHANQVVGNAYTFFDRDIPLFNPLIYTWFFGFGAWWAWRWLEAGNRDLREIWLKLFVCEAALETVGHAILKAYKYYGEQPLDLWGLPLWWPAMNAVPTVATGVALYILAPHLQGRGALAAIPLVPMVSAAAYMAVGLPVFLVLNTGAGLWLTTLVAVGQLGLIALALRFLAVLVGLGDAQRNAGAPLLPQTRTRRPKVAA